jgi:hypothetical protein
MQPQTLTDAQAKVVEAEYKAAFPDATLFPGIGLPSQDHGVMFLTFSLGLGLMKINGLPQTSPVAANALVSAEIINGKTFNIAEVQVPDVPGTNGSPSTVQLFVQAAIAQGLTPAGNHFHWTGECFFKGAVKDHGVAAVHFQDYGMTALDFARKFIAAIKVAVAAIKAKVGVIAPDRVDTCPCEQVVNDRLARTINDQWKAAYPDTFTLPVVGFPSTNGGKFAIFSHTLDGPTGTPMNVNGLPSKSPLANNALYSFECIRGKFMNLYEIMLADVPSCNGGPSSVQVYTNALCDRGLDVAGVHWHFYGGVADANDCGVIAIHHQNYGMSPAEFSRLTIAALDEYEKVMASVGAGGDPCSGSNNLPPCTPCGR